MNIREFTSKDEQQVLGMLQGFMELRVDRYSQESLAFEELIDEDAYLQKLLVDFPKNDVFLVAEKEGELVGYIVAQVQTWKPGVRNPKGHIHSLFVKEEQQGTGIAQQLMQEVSKKLKEKGCQYLELEVNAGNERAKRFYEKLGFEYCNHIMRGELL